MCLLVMKILYFNYCVVLLGVTYFNLFMCREKKKDSTDKKKITHILWYGGHSTNKNHTFSYFTFRDELKFAQHCDQYTDFKISSKNLWAER